MRSKFALFVAYATVLSTVLLVASPALADAGVSGTVSDSLAAGIDGICVEAHDATAEGTVLAFDTTAGGGAYDLGTLTSGDYKLFFYEAADCGNYVRAGLASYNGEWNGDAATFAAATAITVAAAPLVEDATLSDALGSVDGTVYEQDGATVLTGCVTVYLYDHTQETFVDSASAGGSGTYSFTGLVADVTYTLKFATTGASCDDRSSEWLGDANANDGSTNFNFIDTAATFTSVTDGSQTQDASLELAGTINVTMLNEISGANLTDQAARAYPAGSSDFVTVDAVGGVVDLADLSTDHPGGYTVSFPNDGDYEGELWQDKAGNPATGDVVTFSTEGETVLLGTADRHGPGHVYGTITDDETAAPILGATVELYSADGLTLIDSDTTDGSGDYTIFDVPPDVVYDIVVSAATFNSATTDDFTINMTVENETEGDQANVALVPADGTISGTVTDSATTDPIAGATVTLYDDGGSVVVDTAVTDGAGDYTLDGVFPGTYDLRSTADGYVTEWFDDAASAAAGTIVVGYGEAVTADAALVAAAGSISGTVIDDDGGAPIEGVIVTLWDNGGSTALDEAQTDASGAYSFDVAVGTYDVEFAHEDFLGEWYDDVDTAGGAVTVANGEDVIADAGLTSNAGTVSGTISDAATALGVAEVTVEVIDDTDAVVGSAITAADGTFTVEGVSPGSYRVLANTGPAQAPVGYFQKWYVDSPLFLDETATSVVVAATADVTGIDIALQPLFTDVATASTFYQNILWMQQSGITAGCTLTEYCPSDSVTRAQMATFLVRALDLPDSATDYFTDDNGSVHEDNINALRQAEITLGCDATGTVFCPGDPVTRGQMAAFMNRALANLD